MNQKSVLICGVSGVILSLVLVFLSVVSWQIAAVLIAVSLGIPSLILTYERTRSETSVKPKQQEMRKERSLIFKKGAIREETIFVSPKDAY